METKEFTGDIDKKAVACALTHDNLRENSVCFVIGHGASGDMQSGNLPDIASTLAKSCFPVLRYNTSGQLKSRVKILEVGSPLHFLQDRRRAPLLKSQRACNLCTMI